VPEQILKQRLVTQGARTILQVLVRWSSLPLSLSTWEDGEALFQRFPAAPVWGQPGAKGGGVMTATVSDGEQVGIEEGATG
jgi:hypothetical protein